MKQQRADSLRPWLASMIVIASAALPFGSAALTGDARMANQSTTASRRSGVPELRTINQLQEVFQRDSGKVRLVVLISPT